MNKAQIKDAVECLSMNHEAIETGADTMRFCKAHGIYRTLEELREHGKHDRAIRLIAERLAVIFRYRGKVLFLERLASVIHELRGMQT